MFKFKGEVSTTCVENEDKKLFSESFLDSSTINDEIRSSYGRSCIKRDITYITGGQVSQSESDLKGDDMSNVSNESTTLMVFTNSDTRPKRYNVCNDN